MSVCNRILPAEHVTDSISKLFTYSGITGVINKNSWNIIVKISA
jgi:hypothetical protein